MKQNENRNEKLSKWSRCGMQWDVEESREKRNCFTKRRTKEENSVCHKNHWMQI
jgi:hypothetical protein